MKGQSKTKNKMVEPNLCGTCKHRVECLATEGGLKEHFAFVVDMYQDADKIDEGEYAFYLCPEEWELVEKDFIKLMNQLEEKWKGK